MSNYSLISGRGELPIRLTTAQRDAISVPTAGLTIFNTTTNQHDFYNGAAWQTIASSPTGGNYVFAYDTTAQQIAVINTFQNLTYGTNAQISGWTHTVGTGVFECTQTGTYLVNYTVCFERNGAGDNVFEVRALFNAVEVPGSQMPSDISMTNFAQTISNTFILQGVTGQNLTMQIAGGDTDDRVASAGGNATTKPSATITIIRLS